MYVYVIYIHVCVCWVNDQNKQCTLCSLSFLSLTLPMDAERARSSHDDRHRSSKKKKHKDERRRHKHKHHHHHHHRHHKKRRHSDTSSSSSDDDAPLHVDDLEAYWVEKPTNNVTEEQARETTSSTVLQRPAWMLEAPEGMEGFTPVQHPKPPPPSKPLEDEVECCVCSGHCLFTCYLDQSE
jgi:G3E family GTPase